MSNVKVAMVFEFPASEALADEPRTAALAQVSLICDNGDIVGSQLLTHEELLRMICEARAVAKVMGRVSEMVGEEWMRTYAKHRSSS